MKHCINNKLPVSSAGFSLIEALVAFMIISVGMLGIASLQTVSMKAGHTAITRTAAVFNVEDMLDRMRTNPTAIATYDGGTTPDGGDNGCSDISNNTSPHLTSAAATSCTPDELAADDIYRWKRSLAKNVEASIVVVAPVAHVF